jgi:hypothetical protein
MKDDMTRKTHFVSVEVNLVNTSGCENLLKDLEELGCLVTKWPSDPDSWRGTIEPKQQGGADTTILCFCKDIRGLSECSMRQWVACDEREFYVGYRVGEEPFCYQDHFSSETLGMIAELGACIGLAMYPAEPTDKQGLPIELDA